MIQKTRLLSRPVANHADMVAATCEEGNAVPLEDPDSRIVCTSKNSFPSDASPAICGNS